MAEDILTISEVAKMLRVSEDTIRRMIDDGKLPAFKARGNWRIRREEVEKIIRGEK
jgi:excisionase family DNA binding protein